MACSSLREEFRLKMFGFRGVRAERFCYFQWRMPVAVYLLYRLVVMVYGLFWLIYMDTGHPNTAPQARGAYLTVWTYTLLNIYLVAHFLAALLHHTLTLWGRRAVLPPCTYLFRRPSVGAHTRMFLGHAHPPAPDMEGYQPLPGSEGAEVAEEVVLPWYLRLVWVFFNVVSSAAAMVTIVFFVLLFPDLPGYPHIGLENLQEHLINSVIVVLEHLLSAAPYRLLHVVYPFLYGLIYMTFSVVYWAQDHSHVMYPILDWNKVGPTVGYVLMIGFVFIPILHSVFFLAHKAKMAIHRCVYRGE